MKNMIYTQHKNSARLAWGNFLQNNVLSKLKCQLFSVLKNRTAKENLRDQSSCQERNDESR